MHSDLVQGIELAYQHRSDPIVFALTGRTGSGCTTAAQSLCTPLERIPLSHEEFSQPERRKLAIILDFARANWIPFTALSVSSVIYSFLLDIPSAEVDKFLVEKNVPKKGRDELSEHLNSLSAHPSFYTYKKAARGAATPEERSAAWDFFESAVCPRAIQTRRVLANHYQPLFQSFGDNIRMSGAPLDDGVHPESLFALMDRVRCLIDCARAHRLQEQGTTARIVIDAIRNPLELVYLRKHISNLYAVAITADDRQRYARLTQLGFGKRDIDRIDEKEYSNGKHLENYLSFVSQNLKDCIQKADIFVANPGEPGQLASSSRLMNTQLVRYVALALRPGLVTPTRDERCMQIAFVAKLNSGCISRQVGAVIADASHAIHALGWNDVPKGQIPCLLRDVSALLGGSDAPAFSDYEKNNDKFRSLVADKFKAREPLRDRGLRCPFCFKDAYNEVTGKENQVHTRSLHAEENAFLQVVKRGGAGIPGGILYTTASPCELCSKKAYQLGIKEVIYVDPYAGISTSHVLNSGPDEFRPAVRLFSGAVGHAYHRLYDPLLSIKDEYRARLHGAEDGVVRQGAEDDSETVTPDLWDSQGLR